MTIGERIALFRKINKISQQEFADAVEISRTHISKIENNNDMPSTKLLREIAEHYNINYEWLKCGTGEMCISEEEILLKSPEFLKYKLKEVNKNMDRLLKESDLLELQMHLFSLDLLINTFSHIKRKAEKDDYIKYAESIEVLLETLWLLVLTSSENRFLERKNEIIKHLDECIAILKNIHKV